MYRVKEGAMNDFLAMFPQVVAARRDAGFEVVGVWTVPEENRFIWVVGTNDPGGIEGASRRYYESDLRRAITPEPAEFLDEIETIIMESPPGF
jgi:hypothetical protein